MKLPKINPTKTDSWKKLQQHFTAQKSNTIQGYFENDPDRFDSFSIQWEDFLVDYSKNRLTDETMNLLEGLANEMNLSDAIGAYFSGEPINQTEGREVLHTALRAPASAQIYADGLDVVPEVHAIKSKIRSFCNAIISGEHKGYTGKAITHIVNIGIGGSDSRPCYGH